MPHLKKIDLHILMLEDEILDAELIKTQLLLLDEYNCIVEHATDKLSFENAFVKNMPDLVLSDYNLPQYTGIEALNFQKQINCYIPFIFVTGNIDEETAAGTIKAGAWDYVVKDRLFRLPLAIRGVLRLRDERLNSAKVEAKNKQLSMALEQSPLHVIISNTNNIIEYVNARFTEVLGYGADEVIGKDVSIFFPVEYSKNWDNPDFINVVWKGEVQSQKKDGSFFWEYVSISPLRDNNGQTTHYIAVKEDVTQRKKMEQEIIEARDRAEVSDKLKDAFLQNMSHEIRTPLNAIVGFSDLLYEDKDLDRGTIENFTSIIQKSSKQLLSIVTDILTISRIQTQQEKVICNPVDINKLFDHLYKIFQISAQEKNIALLSTRQTTEDKLYTITDETKLTQILTNLINNAIKFTNSGMVEFKYQINDNLVEFSVIDTGIGIAKEHHEMIFERFRQAGPNIQYNYGGTGLGLAISQSFAQMLGGKIIVDSQPGKGATFSFSIPYVPYERKQKLTKNQNNTYTLSTLNILIAEDEPNNYLYIKSLLSGYKITLFHATNGLEAINICNDNPDIDVVLMDIKMPVMDGITAFNEIRKIRNKLPIIAQTAYALEQDKKRIIELGFNDYIAKPIKKEELLKKINNSLPLS